MTVGTSPSAAAEAPASTKSTSRFRRYLYLLPPALVPLVVFWSRILEGGFAGDDWSNLAGHRFTPMQETWDAFTGSPFGYRSLLIPYLRLYSAVLGDNVRLYMIWGIASIMIFAVLIAVLLRRIGVPVWAASAIAALGTIFPYATITKIWFTSHFGHVSGALAVGGVLLALRGLEATGRWRRVAFHAAALLLYLMSALVYEMPVPFIAGAGVVYLWQLGRAQRGAGRTWRQDGLRVYRPALIRWAVDLTMLGLWYHKVSQAAPAKDPNYDLWHRIVEIGTDGARNLAGSFIPFLAADTTPDGSHIYSGAWMSNSQTEVVCAAVAALAVGSLVLGTLSRERFGALRAWGAATLLSVGLACVGWLAIIPATEFYRPVPADPVALRVNVFAAFGLSAVVVCSAAAVGTFLGALVGPRRGALVRGVTIGAALLFVSATWVRHDRSEIQLWNKANQMAMDVLDATRVAIGPHLETGSVVLLADSEATLGSGTEVFMAPWSYNSALQVMYDDRLVDGVPHNGNERIDCRRDGLAPYGVYFWFAHKGALPYGKKTIILSSKQRRAWAITDRATCRRVVAATGLTVFNPATDPAKFGDPSS